MAVNAVFLADFASFHHAVQKAEVELRSFESGANKVTSTLNRMTDSFSGRKIISEATLMAEVFQRAGGSASFTTSELQRMGTTGAAAVEKMRALGIDIPPGIQKIADQAKGVNKVIGSDLLGTLTKVAGAFGIAFSVQSLTRFAGSVFTAASNAHDLALQLGVSAEAAQRYGFAAKQTGTTTEAVGRAISFMNRELSQGDKSTVASLKAAGLEFDAVRAMKPENAFNAIATAVKGIADPMLQAELATKLFSRSGQELLPGIKEGFVEIGNSATVMSDRTVQNLERAQDAWEKLGHTVVTISGNLLSSTIETTAEITSSWKSFFEFAGNVLTFGAGTAAVMSNLSAAAKTTRGDIELLAKPIKKLSQEDLANLDKAAKKATDAQEKFADSLRGIGDELSGGGVIDKATLYMQALAKTVDVTQMTAEKQKMLHGVLDDALAVYAALGEVAPQAMRDTWLATAPLVPLTSDYARTLKGVTQQLELFSSAGGHTLGMQGLADGTRTVLERTIDWRDTLADVVDVLGVVGDKWSTVAQGILRQSQAIVALWEGKNKGAAVGMAIGAAGQFIPTGTTAGSVASGAAQGAAVGSIAGPIGMAVGAGVGALIGWYQSGKAAKQVNDTRDAIVAAAGGFDRFSEAAVRAGTNLKAVLAANTMAELEQAVDAVTDAIKFQNEAMQFVQNTMDKYGLSVADMGTAWSQQNLDEQAASLLKEFRALEAAGADVGLISERMAETLNEYVHSAQEAGTTVPLAMREILNQLVQQGLLVDENGVAFEDLEDAGITFAETLDDAMMTLNDTIERLIEAITRGLGGAISNIPDVTVEGNVHWNIPDIPSLDVSPMQHGGAGRVTRPTLFLAGESGAEDFAFSGVGKRFGGGGTQTIILKNETYLDGRIVAENVVEHFKDAGWRLGVA